MFETGNPIIILRVASENESSVKTQITHRCQVALSINTILFIEFEHNLLNLMKRHLIPLKIEIIVH